MSSGHHYRHPGLGPGDRGHALPDNGQRRPLAIVHTNTPPAPDPPERPVETSTLTARRRAVLNRRGLYLAYATAGYNLAEGVIAVTAGATASSTALLGFGLDSFIEVSSALVIIWQFRIRIPESRERLALRGIAVSFFALAAWITVDALRALFGSGEAHASPVGIGVAATSVVVMPLLVWAKRRTGRELRSATVVADSMQTMLCTYLSAIVLIGLLINAILGWSWADPIAALVVAAVATREGVQAWRGEQCDDCAPTAAVGDAVDRCGCGPDCIDACCTDTEQLHRFRRDPPNG